MHNTIILESFLNYCDEMIVANEGVVKNFIEKNKKLRQERAAQMAKASSEKAEYFKKMESVTKSLLFKITKDYVSVFNKEVSKCKYFDDKLYVDKDNYDFDERNGRYAVIVDIDEGSTKSGEENRLAREERRECYKVAEKYVMEKYKDELNGKSFDIQPDTYSIDFVICIKYNPTA